MRTTRGIDAECLSDETLSLPPRDFSGEHEDSVELFVEIAGRAA